MNAGTSGWKNPSQAASRPWVKTALFIRLAIAASLLGVAGCGNMADLRPAEGQSLPVKPLMANSTPTPEQLLTPPAYADPDRIDELMRRSEPREADRFDLPPPSGQAPEVPVEAEDDEQANQVGPVTPQ